MAARHHDVKLARLDELRGAKGGTRVLVDCFWPGGPSKEQANIDGWCKTVASRTGLREWCSHDPQFLEESTRRYRSELEQPAPTAALAHLRVLAAQDTLSRRRPSLDRPARPPSDTGRMSMPCCSRCRRRSATSLRCARRERCPRT